MRGPIFHFTIPISNCRRATSWKTSKRLSRPAGSSLDNVFKAQVFLTDLQNFNGFDEVWKEYFKVPPARNDGRYGLLVRDTLVEIDLIGCVTEQRNHKQAVKSGAPQAACKL